MLKPVSKRLSRARCGVIDAQRQPFGVLDFFAWDHDWSHRHYDPQKILRAIRLMKKAGVGIVRTDFLWQDVEPRRGQFCYAKYDRIVRMLRAHKIEVLGVLHYNVSWNSGNWNEPPDPELFAAYAERVARRYRGKVAHWEIWNEPNYETYWSKQDGMRAYARLLKTVVPRIRKADEDCRILHGGLTRRCALSLSQLYRHGAKKYFDIVNIHPFCDPLLPADIQALRRTYEAVTRVMCRNRDSEKPIWFTEIGCPGVARSKKIKDWWFGPNPDERDQALFLQRLYREAACWPHVDKIFWAFFRDTDKHFKDGIDYFGLLRNDFSKKPSYQMYRQLAR